MAGLCEFSELPFITANNVLPYFISLSVSDTDGTRNYGNMSYVRGLL